MKRYLASIVVFSFPALLLAQTAQMALPDGNGAWVVRVATTGGILGTGVGDFAISSEGRLSCGREAHCPRDFKVSAFQRMVEAIHVSAQQASAQQQVPATGLCSDCVTRTMTIIRRDSTGTVLMYAESWSDVTKSRLSQEVVRLYDALVEVIK